ncbi:MAG: hypothetical protein ACK41D_03045 [Rubricoccaceae bacterium]
MLLIVYLDAYHLGDPLFIDRFARIAKACAHPLVLVHGTGEAAELALEGSGREPAREGGVLRLAHADDAETVARAGRELSRRLVHALNEAGVSALRVTGADRGLLRATADGALEAPGAAWVAALARQGAVPAVLALVRGEVTAPLREVDPAAAAAALARATGGTLVALARSATGRLPERAAPAEAAALAGDPEGFARLAASGLPLRLAPPGSLAGPEAQPPGIAVSERPATASEAAS